MIRHKRGGNSPRTCSHTRQGLWASLEQSGQRKMKSLLNMSGLQVMQPELDL